MSSKFDYDLIVIGSGAGGSIAAAIGAHGGLKVALVESHVLGGDSANFGDVPTQTLLNVARIYGEAKNGDMFGIRSGMVGYNYPTIKAWKDRVVSRVGESGSKRYYESLGVHVILGLAHFISPHVVSVNRRHISASNILVATGAEWTIPEIDGLQKHGYLTPRSALDLIRPPKSLFVIGGGSTGLELTRLFSTFGSKVYISEIAPRLLPREDQEVGELITDVLSKKNGITPLVGTRVMRITKEGLSRRVYYNHGQEEKSVRVDEILVASGKMPRVDVGLENAGIVYSPRGMEANEFLQTEAKHIYGAGDVLGGFGLTHVALMESRIAIHNIMNKNKLKPDYKAVPRIAYLTPEVASVGYSEDDLIKRDLDYHRSMVPISLIGRSNITNQKDGFVKVLVDKKSRRILGATVVAPNAGETIHELTLAIQHDITVDAVANTLHAFPSWSEAVRIACAKT